MDGVSPVKHYACLAFNEGGGGMLKTKPLEVAVDFDFHFGRYASVREPLHAN